MRELPATGDAAGRKALKRLQEVGVHVVSPIEHLNVNPFNGAVALIPLKSIAAARKLPELPAGTVRYVVTIDGTESDAELKALEGVSPMPAFALLNIAVGTSRVHASRRVFEFLRGADVEGVRDLAVIHHRVYEDKPSKDLLILTSGSEVRRRGMEWMG